MADNTSIELRCSKTSDGKYNASTFVNGKHLKEAHFSVNRGDEFAIVLLYQKLKKQYPKSEPQVKGMDKHGMEMILHSTTSA
ncbi:MAG: hypothetical protein PHP42_10595 [Bacteroidota bacterium]|nr:hypothetical protein [Bacteroidota bacterium]